MNRRLLRSLSISVAATAALALGLAGCSSATTSGGDDAANAEPIRMGTQPWLGYGGWFIAEEEGYFAERGLNVELSNFNADAEMNAALVADRIDMANVGAQAALQFVEEGLDVSIVLLLDSATGADAIIAGSGINSMKDLAGKSVAFERGATSEILLAEALDAAGMSFDDIKVVEADADQVAPMLVSDRVEAGVTYEPYISEALASEDSLSVLTSAGEHPGLITDVLVVRNDVLAERPDEVREVLASWDDSIAFLEEDPEAGRSIIATGVGSSAADLDSAFNGVHFYTLAENRDLLEGAYSTAQLPALVEVAVRIGLIKDSVDASTVIDAGYLGD